MLSLAWSVRLIKAAVSTRVLRIPDKTNLFSRDRSFNAKVNLRAKQECIYEERSFVTRNLSETVPFTATKGDEGFRVFREHLLQGRRLKRSPTPTTLLRCSQQHEAHALRAHTPLPGPGPLPADAWAVAHPVGSGDTPLFSPSLGRVRSPPRGP